MKQRKKETIHSLLYCKEKINTRLLFIKISSINARNDKLCAQSTKNNPSAEYKKKSRKSYIAYTNAEKIDFLLLAAKVGAKKAAIQMRICWSTAKAWLKKEEALQQINQSYITVLQGIFRTRQIDLGTKLKVGVGRKVTYGQEVEEEILIQALKLRESEGGMGVQSVKKKAIEIIKDKHTKFKGSEGWYKKFCHRNELHPKDKFDPPKSIPM